MPFDDTLTHDETRWCSAAQVNPDDYRRAKIYSSVDAGLVTAADFGLTPHELRIARDLGMTPGNFARAKRLAAHVVTPRVGPVPVVHRTTRRAALHSWGRPPPPAPATRKDTHDRRHPPQAHPEGNWRFAVPPGSLPRRSPKTRPARRPVP